MLKYWGLIVGASMALFPVLGPTVLTVPPRGVVPIQQSPANKPGEPNAQDQPDKGEESRGDKGANDEGNEEVDQAGNQKEQGRDRWAWLEPIGIAVTAIFTAVLAVATITLWYQTKKLAEFAAEQAGT